MAKRGKCRICQRVRNTKYLKIVGEIRHGYATGHIWECEDVAECRKVAKERIANNHKDKGVIEIALKKGRFKDYVIYT